MQAASLYGALTCVSCVDDQFSAFYVGANNTKCFKCLRGHSCKNGVMEQCGLGFYQSDPGQTSCKVCPVGSQTDQNFSSTSCTFLGQPFIESSSSSSAHSSSSSESSSSCSSSSSSDSSSSSSSSSLLPVVHTRWNCSAWVGDRYLNHLGVDTGLSATTRYGCTLLLNASVYYSSFHSESYVDGLLHLPPSASLHSWSPQHAESYMELDLGDTFLFYGLVVQGRSGQWTTQMDLRLDGDATVHHLYGNRNDREIVYSFLSTVRLTRFVRIFPLPETVISDWMPAIWPHLVVAPIIGTMPANVENRTQAGGHIYTLLAARTYTDRAAMSAQCEFIQTVLCSIDDARDYPQIRYLSPNIMYLATGAIFEHVVRDTFSLTSTAMHVVCKFY